MEPRIISFAAAALLLATGCAAYPPTVGEYSVGGTVSGLSEKDGGVMIGDSAGSAVFVTKDGRFRITNAFPDGVAYDIAIVNDPSIIKARCTVSNGSGTIAAGDVEDVSVVCQRSSFTVGGSVSGLSGSNIGLVLANGDEAVAVSKDGSFAFQRPQALGSAWAVTIAQQPDGATCAIENASGTGNSDITNVTVSCVTSDSSVSSEVEEL